MQSIFPAVLLFGIVLLVRVDAFRIGAFNVQVFGQSKAGKTDVMNTLAKVLYPIALLV